MKTIVIRPPKSRLPTPKPHGILSLDKPVKVLSLDKPVRVLSLDKPVKVLSLDKPVKVLHKPKKVEIKPLSKDKTLTGLSSDKGVYKYIYPHQRLVTEQYIEFVLENNKTGLIFRDINEVSPTGNTWKERYKKGEMTEQYVIRVLEWLGLECISIKKGNILDGVHRVDIICDRVAIQVKSSYFLFQSFIEKFYTNRPIGPKPSPLCVRNQLCVLWVPNNPKERAKFIVELASLFHISINKPIPKHLYDI